MIFFVFFFLGGRIFFICYLQGVFELVADVDIFVIVVDLWVVSNQGVLRADVDGVVDLPVDVPHFPGWMEQTLQNARQFEFTLYTNTMIQTFKVRPILTPR